MNTWVSDNIPMAGGAFRQLIVDLYRNDRLMKGELMIRGERVDLQKLHANLLTVIAEGDHITPPCQSEPIMARSAAATKKCFACAAATSASWPAAAPEDHLAAHRAVAGPAVEVKYPKLQTGRSAVAIS